MELRVQRSHGVATVPRRLLHGGSDRQIQCAKAWAADSGSMPCTTANGLGSKVPTLRTSTHRYGSEHDIGEDNEVAKILAKPNMVGCRRLVHESLAVVNFDGAETPGALVV